MRISEIAVFSTMKNVWRSRLRDTESACFNYKLYLEQFPPAPVMKWNKSTPLPWKFQWRPKIVSICHILSFSRIIARKWVLSSSLLYSFVTRGSCLGGGASFLGSSSSTKFRIDRKGLHQKFGVFVEFRQRPFFQKILVAPEYPPLGGPGWGKCLLPPC